jgi:hypothetical protein
VPKGSALRSVGGNNSVVECDLAKVEVAGSNPVSRSNFGTSRPSAARAGAHRRLGAPMGKDYCMGHSDAEHGQPRAGFTYLSYR